MKRSIRVVPSVAARLYKDATERSLTCYILGEDLHLSVFPFQDEQQHVTLSVLRGDEEAVRRAVALAISEERDTGWFAQRFGDFVRSAAQIAVAYGDASYEIVFERGRLRGAAREPDSEFSFGIDPIMPTTLHHIFGRPVQIIPGADAKEWGRRLIWLDKSSTFTLTLPGIPPGRWRRMMEALATLDQGSHDATLLNRPGFEFRTQQEFLRASQLLITCPIPWVQRGSLRPESMSEFYGLYKWLLMKRFVFRLRERVVSLLNDILSAAGRVKGFSATVSVSSLPRAEDVDRAISDLLAGQDSTENLVRRFL